MTRHLTSLAISSALLTVGLAGPACTGPAEGDDESLATIERRGATPSGAIIRRWNLISRTALLPMDPASSSRAFAMVHIAMHDAVNGVADRYETYLLDREDQRADPVVAAAQAAHDVLVALRPAQQANLDAELATDLAAQPDASKRNRGIALGREAAELIIGNRADDGTSATVPYTPGTGPGAYQYTPPFNFVILTQWPAVTPFALKSGSQFRAGPPPALDCDEWADAYNEVKERGSATSKVRTADESEMAIFWQENSALSASKIAETISIEKSANLYSTARAFALMFMAMTDGAIVVTDTKYAYDFWRPITAIRAGDTDGRADTVADPSWTHFIVAPPFPEYASGHATLGMAMAVALDEVWGDDVSFWLTSSVNNATRSYDDVYQAAVEGAESRILGGIHYRFAAEQGLAHGWQVGRYVVDRFLERDD